jgi:hypothetical protein
MIAGIITLSVFLLIAVFVIWNLYNKVTKQEDIIEYQVTYLRNISEIIVESNLYIQKLDEKGHFKADDEVGVFFEFIKEIQANINTFELPQDYGKSKK